MAWPAASAIVSGVSASLLSRLRRAIRSSSPVIRVPAEPAANTASPTVTRSALRGVRRRRFLLVVGSFMGWAS